MNRAMRRVIAAGVGSIVVVDESVSARSRGRRGCRRWQVEHLLVMRTVSKLELAGIRLELYMAGSGVDFWAG